MQSFRYLAATSVVALAAAPLYAAPVAIKGQDFVRQAALPAWVVAPLRASASEKTDPVVDLVSETQVWAGATTATLYNRAVLVNDQSALAGIGQYALTYVPAYQHLLIHRVAIIRKGQLIDHTATVSIRALEREEGLEKGVYGGAKTMQMLLRDVRIGDTLWVTYTIEGANPVFGGKMHRVEAWDSEFPAEQRRLVVTYPRKRSIGWTQLGDFVTGKLEPRVEEVGENTRLTFDGRELAALEGEPSTPAEYMPGRILQFSEFADWKAVAQWASALFEPAKSTPQLAALADSLAKGGTQTARATAALRWVQDEVRYFSVSIGENSHRPQLPEVVLRNRYGDCKDKSRLLVALLRQMGIEAKPVLVSASAPRLPARVKPSPSWFDHVIVRVTIDGRDYFVDPTQTGQTEALADLRPALAGGSGLVVDPATSALLAIPVDSSEVPHFELSENLAVPQFDGAGTLLAKRYYWGDYAAWARRHFSSLSQPLQRKWALELYEKQYPGVTLLEAPTVAEENGRFVMTARYSVPKPVEHKDQVYKISYDTRILEGSLDIPAKIARNYPFVPASGKYRSRYRLTMELPKALRLNVPPAGRQLDSPYLAAHDDYILRGNLIDYQLDYRIKESRVPASDMPALHETSKKLQEFLSGTFKVTDDQLSPPSVAGFPYRDFQLALMWDGMVAYRSRSQGKKPAEVSLQDTCAYATMFFAIRPTLRTNSVFEGEALHKRLLSEQKDPKAIECTPYSLLVAGDGAGALSVLAAGKLADNSPQLAEQVTARWVTGDLAGAASDMERSYKAKSVVAQVNGFDTLRLLTLLQRAGRHVPEELMAKAKRHPRGPWPLPLLALQAGTLDAAEVEAIARAMPADAAVMALNDYWFQVGELALTRKDTTAARKAFGWLNANGIRASIPYILAQAELARLDRPEPEAVIAMNLLLIDERDEGLYALRNAAKRGSAPAQYKLGMMYREGQSVPKDPARAAQLFLAAASQGHAGAQNEAGNCYLLGLGLPANAQLAAEWFRKAAEYGDEIALYNLASLYRHGKGVEEDHATAFALMRASAGLGLTAAQEELVSYYRQGIGVKADVQQTKLWELFASQENDGASIVAELLHLLSLSNKEQSLPGFYFESGVMSLPDKALALEYLRAAAEHGDAAAMMNLGRMYRYGFAVKQDLVMARDWMKKAHAKHDPDATYFLAEMLYYGLGGSADVPAAIELWAGNAELSARSAFALGQAYNTDGKVAIDRALALKFYAIGARQEYGAAINNLGEMYELGQGVQQSYPKAIELYKRAALAENRTAFLSFSSLFANGLGVKKDLRIAYTYLALAEKYGLWERRKEHKELAAQLPAAVRKEAEAFAETWTVRTPLPGFSEASASPAGRE
ncbi:DUF3857 domain-containing protein [Duganella sp. Root198D2]|uniref:DUF3857 domain-containing protein n=1 Tax=Duganella sp. Root198D2 TaxID=1736489 RepID=UPI0009E7AD7A|nr:DUF3857 domain-containing protein [Duganella sp. Root198D2]